MHFIAIFIWVLILLIVLYILFQCKMLSPWFGRYIAMLFFYPTLPLTYLSRRKEYWSHLDKNVYIGAVPIQALNHFSMLKDLHITCIVNLLDESKCVHQMNHMLQLYLPTIDHEEPSFEDIKAAVAFIDHHAVQLQHGVYIHCKSGNGRSAAIGFAWLLYQHRKSMIVTQKMILSKRKVRPYLYRQPNLVRYYNYLHER